MLTTVEFDACNWGFDSHLFMQLHSFPCSFMFMEQNLFGPISVLIPIIIKLHHRFIETFLQHGHRQSVWMQG